MKLTAFTDYSLRVLIYVAAQPQGRATIAEIAQTYEISENHLTKVVHSLGKAGFLANVRGHGGGLALARLPKDINVGAVVRHAEGAMLPAACFDADSPMCRIAAVCQLQDVLSEAMNAFYKVLDQYTLEHLVRNRKPLSEILFATDPHFRASLDGSSVARVSATSRRAVGTAAKAHKTRGTTPDSRRR